jgi:ComF family protein
VLGDDPICSSCIQEFVPADVIRNSHDDGPLKLTVTLYSYTGRPGQAVRRLKYSRATTLAPPLAQMLADGIQRVGLTHYDLVVPIPIHWSRRCTRGFNQSELLCEAVCFDARVLSRIRRTRPQARLDREARMHNLVGAFAASPQVAGMSVLLVDDVLTSGHTARECARALADAGATKVAALALTGEAF